MQSNFFDPTQGNTQTSPPLLPGPTADRPAKRVFLYDGQVFEDPGPEYSVQDILSFLAETYPELENATWTSRTLPDGASGEIEEITFVKVTGEKGAVSPLHLADSLAALKPADIQAVRLVQEIEQGKEAISAADLLALSPRIDAALSEANRLSEQSRRIVRQCLNLTPIPHPNIPLGF